MANPDPEIDYNLAIGTEAILYCPQVGLIINQVNNVLGFPYIF
jgi:malate dehydrogenase (oxaloacetate-decarboxylating)(NADP+)